MFVCSMPYNRIGNFEGECFPDSPGHVEVGVFDHTASRYYEVRLDVRGDRPKVYDVSQRVYRGAGKYMRSVTKPAIAAAALDLYARHLKLGKEPVVNDYIDEGVRIIEVQADGSYLTAYDAPEERIVYLGGGAVEWHKRKAA